jgi:hypothetical protein
MMIIPKIDNKADGMAATTIYLVGVVRFSRQCVNGYKRKSPEGADLGGCTQHSGTCKLPYLMLCKQNNCLFLSSQDLQLVLI